jgi:phosphoribosylformylglycinamidine cyclo-ligase
MESQSRSHSAYAAAGVDIAAKNRLVRRIKDLARGTFVPGVERALSDFGGVFSIAAAGLGTNTLLVASIDGVGTKLRVAFATGIHDTVGYDLVCHSVNDILTTGASPLFFLDYVACGRLDPVVLEAVVSGIARGCRETGCALLGGETAEMPGHYPPGEYDVAGCIVGAVARAEFVDGCAIQAGDVLLGLPSNGLHTNGFSLVRRVFAGVPYDQYMPELGRTLGEELLRTHRCYLFEIRRLREAGVHIKGMAHITGGGLIDNIPRMLPVGLAARLWYGSWPVPPIFSLVQERGRVSFEEMCHVFNLGLGYVLAVSPDDVERARAAVPELIVAGEVVPAEADPRVIVERRS